MNSNSHVLLLFTLALTSVRNSSLKEYEEGEDCLISYERGVAAYLENNFEECVTQLEDGLKKYSNYTKALQSCRIKCKEDAEFADRLYPVDLEDMYFYEKAVRNTLCLMKCQKRNPVLGKSVTVTPETDQIYQDAKPYEYLHLCYYQKKELQKAVSSAFTYLVTHPKDDLIRKSLQFYSTLPEVDMSTVVNYEAKEHVYLYAHGMDAYDKKDWKSVENNMEESLVAYLQAEENCRALCEGPFNQGWFPDLVPSIANHYTFSLKCKRKCPIKLNNLNGQYHEDLLPSHYHYLQYAYFKDGNLKSACQAAASYVLFYPNDDTMRSNMEYYKKLPKVDNSFFTPRPEAVQYVRRFTYENRLLKFIDKEYKFQDNEESPAEVFINLKKLLLQQPTTAI
ncbi:prolyl 3-hydroxylase 1-like isoform X1 [Photinus pyralis]|uniref:prolyl 3-hydroxylase 1-like isoform X1 n=1 Tax=Photinus pyralis TaxID=7054 RepID=UPI001266F448|nr:prolyl 3-hydroxylase 1-like isoform X1 [Photinus pyralis]XP_031334137.1 prolyl 3-hydroxylase 1-like isoform X1 [Photinus pyralis]